MERERLTWEQIKKRYPSQYVGLTDIVRDPSHNMIASAIVICSSATSSYENMLDQAVNGAIYMTYPTADDTLTVGFAE